MRRTSAANLGGSDVARGARRLYSTTLTVAKTLDVGRRLTGADPEVGEHTIRHVGCHAITKRAAPIRIVGEGRFDLSARNPVRLEQREQLE